MEPRPLLHPPLPAECCRLQAKITHHTKNQADLKLSEKRQPRDVDSEVAEALELSGRDSKAAITKTLPQAITNMIATNEKIESLSKEIEYILNGNLRTKKFDRRLSG